MVCTTCLYDMFVDDFTVWFVRHVCTTCLLTTLQCGLYDMFVDDFTSVTTFHRCCNTLFKLGQESPVQAPVQRHTTIHVNMCDYIRIHNICGLYAYTYICVYTWRRSSLSLLVVNSCYLSSVCPSLILGCVYTYMNMYMYT